MEHRRHILPSSYPPQNLPLDDPSGLSRTRQPLSDAAGNSQLHALASVGLYHDSKGLQPRVDRPMYAIPTLPSQPSRQPLGNTLELRRQSTRRRRHQKYSRNPIVDSPQYQAYRARQNRDGNPDDAKWPEVLEIAFLDALIEIPPMGRRKFSYRGKPHGRNELIKEYLWIAYLQSLTPSQRPDESMARTRKQVSSHIQVLKGFLRDHPAFDRLFPSNKAPKNGFEDSFKNDPCLRALSEGRLPTRRYEQFENMNQMIMTNHAPIKPAVFWLLITSSSVPDDVSGRYTSEGDLCRDGVVAHKYTGLSSQRRRDNLETISNWRQRFPSLERLYSSSELNCDIIHMDVSLELMRRHAPDGSELVTRMEMSIPGREFTGCQWQTVTSLVKPPELYLDPVLDPPMETKTFITEVLASNEVETRIKVPFPANAWAHAFTCLTNLQIAHEENRKAHSFTGDTTNSSTRSAREYVDRISMYQEVQSSSGPGVPFMRRAIVLWTFHKARHGDEGGTTWRYLDPLPPRRMCMSPSPHRSHHISAAMSENFNSWADPQMHLQNSSMLDTFVQGLATPPTTGGLQSPFAGPGYGYPAQQFDMAQENISFVSNATAESESTLVDNETTTHIDNFLSNTNINLGDFEHHSSTWHMPQTESFDADPAWANYTVRPSTPQLGWESDSKNQTWPEPSPTKQTTWIDDANVKHDWNDNLTSPTKEERTYAEQNIEQKLLSWIDHHPDVAGETKNTFSETSDLRLPDLPAGTIDTKDQGWAVGDSSFDFNHLTERLK